MLLLGLSNLPGYAQDITAETIITSFEKMYQGLHDYQCRMKACSIQGRNYEKRIINFYFKKPRKIRMDILEGNKLFDSGSVGVYSGGEYVSGRKGGIISCVPVRVGKKNPMATTIRGLTFDESDMQATLEKLQFHLKKSVITVKIISPDTYQLTCIPPDPLENAGISQDIIWINSKTLLPLSADSYEGDRLVQQAEWGNYILNAGLPDELFHIFYNPEKLVERGISSIHQLPWQKQLK